jgi:hypothetical protein
MMMLPIVGKSQSTCNTAENDFPSTNTQEMTRICTGSTYWFTFIGDSTKNYNFYAYINDSLSIQESPIISFYQGICNSLNLISQDTMSVIYNNMATGVRYYVKAEFIRDAIEFKYFSGFLEKDGLTDCDSTQCDYLKNGNFTYMDPVLSTNPFHDSGKICKWRTIFTRRCSPQATNAMGAQDNGYAFMWSALRSTTDSSQFIWNELIFQNTYLPTGVYDVSMAYRRDVLSIIECDHLIVKIMPNIVNPPNLITGSFLNAQSNALDIQNVNNTNWDYATSEFIVNQSGNYAVFALPFQTSRLDTATWVDIDNIHVTPKPTAQILTTYCKPYMNFGCTLNGCHPIDHIVWNFGDGTSYTTAQGESIASHNYSTGGSYTVTASIFYRIYNSPAIANITQTILVNIGGSVNTLSIAGNRSTCDTIVSYSPINTLPGTNCTWTIDPSSAGTIISNNNNTATINWHENAITNGQPVILTLNDGLCSASINIWKCCKDSSGTATVLNDETITSNINNGNYYLNGIITIDGNVTFTNATFNMAPEAKIVIKSPSTFNVNLSTIKAGCNYMWDGIYTKSRHSYVNTESSTIQDAQNAISSENGAYVSVSNTLFNLNNYGIKVYNSLYDNPLIVSNCRFYCTTDGTGATPRNLITPLNNDRGAAGIDINNVSAIQVGDINKATKNKFSYTVYGINISNSNATVNNNNFVNFPVVGNNFGAGIAISGNSSTTRSTVIGGYNSGNNVYTNLFSNCRIGIYQEYQANIKILCDTFVSCTESATKILANSYRNIDFTKNRIQTAPYGLLINDFIKTRLVADSNSIYDVTNGITASNATAQECYGATFRKNTITGTFTNGIMLSNVKERTNMIIHSPGYERQIPYIYANAITLGSYNLTGSTDYSGIRVENGNSTYIEDNIVSTPSYAGTDLTQALKLNGIYAIASPKTSMCSNTITRLGMGIRMNGLCTASPIKSNTMNNNYYGVRLDAATIGNQGVPSVSWVNRNWWNTPFIAGRYRVQGSVAVATTWTYDYNFGNSSNYTLLSTSPEYSVTGGYTTTSVASPVPQTCVGFDGVIWIPYNGGNKGGESEELSVMENYQMDTEENQYYQASDYYYDTQSDNLNMDAVESTDAPVNPIQTTSIITFYKVDKLISDNRVNDAIDLNNSIVPVNLIEKNHKTTNAIYLQSWAKGRFELTDDEKSTLLDIANQPHIQGGYGVFTAWVMLNRSIQNDVVKPKSIIKPFGNNTIGLYPNPAREQVTVTGASEVTFVTIYDIQGRELLKVGNPSCSNIFTINTSKLSKGVYFISLINNNSTDKIVEKLVIE